MKEKIELFDQNYGLNSLKKERFLILSKMDICSSLKKAGFYPPHHFLFKKNVLKKRLNVLTKIMG